MKNFMSIAKKASTALANKRLSGRAGDLHFADMLSDVDAENMYNYYKEENNLS